VPGYAFEPPAATFTDVGGNVTADFSAFPAPTPTATPTPTPAPTPAPSGDVGRPYSINYGAALFPQPTASDHNFVIQPATPFAYRAGGPVVFDVAVNRVVGEVNPDGTLADPQTLVRNGVVSKVARLRVLAFDVDSGAAPPAHSERDRVLLNGRDIGPQGAPAYLQGEEGVWRVSEFEVPIELVRFGRRNVGGVPTPGVNRVEIRIDEASPAGDDRWATAVDRASLSFDALAPVIMIHGTDSTSAFFDDWAFTLPFRQQQIPFDATINMTTDSIAAHGAALAELVPARARSFGANRVHLVAHSKGGLDARDFLARAVPQNFGVLSLVTLSTPHHGSVLADYLVDASRTNALLSDNLARSLLMQSQPPNVGTYNLRVGFVEGFNARNVPGLPWTFTVDGETTPVTYVSFAADANLNGSVDFFTRQPNIDASLLPVDWITGSPRVDFYSEIIGTDGYRLGDVGLSLANMVYATAGNVATTGVEWRTLGIPPLAVSGYGIRERPTASFKLNDLLVTQESARLGERFVAAPATKANHATVANRNIAGEVIRRVRAAQPIR
jgi:hypothetical protein